MRLFVDLSSTMSRKQEIATDDSEYHPKNANN